MSLGSRALFWRSLHALDRMEAAQCHARRQREAAALLQEAAQRGVALDTHDVIVLRRLADDGAPGAIYRAHRALGHERGHHFAKAVALAFAMLAGFVIVAGLRG